MVVTVSLSLSQSKAIKATENGTASPEGRDLFSQSTICTFSIQHSFI